MNFATFGRSLALAAILVIWSGCLGAGQVNSDSHQQLAAPQASADSKLATSAPRYVLHAEKRWQLNPPGGEQFDASGLLVVGENELLTINDRGPSVFRMALRENESAAHLTVLTNLFTKGQLAAFAKEKQGRYDCEGLARDEEGRLYICEESNRWILRYDPKRNEVERLRIDWSPVRKYFSPTDPNASFEGVAVGKGRLYVANERQSSRILVVDLSSLAVIDDFTVRPAASPDGEFHYSDLCWFEDAVFVLLRNGRCVLKVDPRSHRVLAEYDFRQMENDPEAVYRLAFLFGTMEGLAVDKDSIWLVTDNNGLARVRYPKDTRPTLFKCARPDRKP